MRRAMSPGFFAQRDTQCRKENLGILRGRPLPGPCKGMRRCKSLGNGPCRNPLPTGRHIQQRLSPGSKPVSNRKRHLSRSAYRTPMAAQSS